MQSADELLKWNEGPQRDGLEPTEMPVKVRCPECEKVLNAPDRARGKAIKCPACGSAVRVPAEKASAAKPAARKPAKKLAAPPPSSSGMIVNLDLDQIEDAQTRICPKCGTEVDAEDAECPSCHVNLGTGLLSAERKADLSRKGPNPKLYYKEFFKDGIEFWKKEKRLSFRLTILWIVFCLLFVCSIDMSLWSVKPLVRAFWIFIGTIELLIPPGLTWNLHTTIIDATLRKKKKLGKYTFDRFLGAAISLKLIVWFLGVAAPLHIAALVFLVLGARGMPVAPLVAGALEVAAFVFASLLFPIASTHMAMPITIRGWLPNKMSKPFFRTMPAVLYWCFFFYLTLLVPIGCLAVIGVFSGNRIVEQFQNANTRSAIFDAKGQIAMIPRGKDIPEELQDIAKITEPTVDLSVLYLPTGLLLVAAAAFGMTAVFSMRTNGQYARYFLDQLDLETMAAEVTYVPKAKNLEEFEAKQAGLSWKPVLMGLGLGYAVPIFLGASIGMSFYTGMLQGITFALLIAGSAMSFVGFWWSVIALIAKRSQLKYSGAVLLSGWIASGIGGGIFATTEFRSGPAAPEKEVMAKPG
jgi:DNA-directed RNA polymerase subunit M/transcription elongation factor TFIIS